MSESGLSGTAVVLIIAGTLAFFILLIWSIKRHRDPRLQVKCSDSIDDLLQSLAGLTFGTVVPGNSLEVLENREYFRALIDEIGRARRTVHFETFLWKEGQIGSRLAEAFIERARAGVAVRLLLDATGTRRMAKADLARMREAG